MNSLPPDVVRRGSTRLFRSATTSELRRTCGGALFRMTPSCGDCSRQGRGTKVFRSPSSGTDNDPLLSSLQARSHATGTPARGVSAALQPLCCGPGAPEFVEGRRFCSIALSTLPPQTCTASKQVASTTTRSKKSQIELLSTTTRSKKPQMELPSTFTRPKKPQLELPSTTTRSKKPRTELPTGKHECLFVAICSTTSMLNIRPGCAALLFRAHHRHRASVATPAPRRSRSPSETPDDGCRRGHKNDEHLEKQAS